MDLILRPVQRLVVAGAFSVYNGAQSASATAIVPL